MVAGSGNVSPALSFVVPVYNAATTIGEVVQRIRATCGNESFEIVLVNDGSRDQSEQVCQELARQWPELIVFAQLSRNFGEHNAVLAGLRIARGKCVAVLDDDGQNPPEEVPAMRQKLLDEDLDVVYGRYMERKHSLLRRLGSAFNDRMANVMLGKPRGLYLSSFKVMSRFVVEQIVLYQGPFPYIDGIIWRATGRVDQIDVQHDERLAGASNYNMRRLIRLWLNMFLGFSILPLRVATLTGVITAGISVLGFIAVIVDKLWITPELTMGIPTTIASIVFFSGVQLIVLGTIGEYVGRIFLGESGTPQSVVRYVVEEGTRSE